MPVRPEQSRRFPGHTYFSSHSVILNKNMTFDLANDVQNELTKPASLQPESPHSAGRRTPGRGDKQSGSTANKSKTPLTLSSSDPTNMISSNSNSNQQALIRDLHDQVRWCVDAIGNLFNSISDINITVQELAIQQKRVNSNHNIRQPSEQFQEKSRSKLPYKCECSKAGRKNSFTKA